MQTTRRPPKYKGPLPWGHLASFARDPLGCVERGRRAHGDAFEIRIGLKRMHIFTTASAARHVLQANQRNYRRPDAWSTILQSVTGPNVFNTDGEPWLSRRRTMQPAFQRARFDDFATAITSIVDAEIESWPTNVSIDAHAHSLSLAMAVVGRTLFGDAFERQREQLQTAFKLLLDEVFRRLVFPVRLPEFVPTPRNLRLRRSRNLLFDFVDGLVAECRAGTRKIDLLQMLAAATDPETGRSLGDVELRNEALTMVHAGHETTASALTSSMWLLGRHREWQSRLRGEVQRECGDGPPTAESIGRCEQLDRFVRETLRMYPPGWMSADRVAIADDVVDGYEVRANEGVWISLREIHRNERYWKDPDVFDPDRFAPERSAGRPKMAWIPFAGGRRRCIGEHLAMLELRIALSRILARFELTTADNRAEPELDVGFTLAPKNVAVRLDTHT